MIKNFPPGFGILFRLCATLVDVSSSLYYRNLNTLRTCFGPTCHLQVYNLVLRRRSFKVIATAASSFSGWHCAPCLRFWVTESFSIFFRCEGVLACSCFLGSIYSALWSAIVFVVWVFLEEIPTKANHSLIKYTKSEIYTLQQDAAL
jgi:hypothetical protein